MDPELYVENIEDQETNNINSKIWESFEQILEEFFPTPTSINSERRFMILLGAWLNETLYNQQKIFGTQSMIKNLSNYLKHTTYKKIKILYKVCERLQGKIHKNKRLRIKTSLIEENVKKLWKSHNPEEFKRLLKNSRNHVNFLIVTGYNLYSKVIQNIFELTSWSPKSEDFIDISSFHGPYSEGKESSVALGYFSGLYFLELSYLQQKILRTKGLIKLLSSIVKLNDLSNVSRFIAELNLISMKIIGLPKYLNTDSNQENASNNQFYKSRLPGSIFQLKLSKILLNHTEIELNSNFFTIGLGIAFSLKLNKLSLENNYDIPENIEIVNDKKGKVVITEEIIVQDLKNNELSDKDTELAYLQGIMFQKIKYLESSELSIEPLTKRFGFLFRHFNHRQMVNFQSATYKSIINIWINREIDKEIGSGEKSYYSYIPFPRILLQMIKCLIQIDDISSREIPRNTLAFIQGYALYSQLYNKYNS